MITRAKYIEILADLLNRDAKAKVRERRVREANRELYKVVVSKKSTNAQADLALAEAANLNDNSAQEMPVAFEFSSWHDRDFAMGMLKQAAAEQKGATDDTG